MIFLFTVFSVHLAVADDAVDQKLNAALTLFDTKAYSEVVTVLDGIISKSAATVKQKVGAYALRGDTYLKLAKPRNAYADYSSAIEHQEKVTDGEAYLALLLKEKAILAESFQEYKVANASFRRAVQLDPENAEIANNLAWFLATSPDDSFHDGLLAVHYATRACTLTKFDSPEYLDTLAAAFARAGRYDLAVSYQKQAIAHPKLLELFSDEEIKNLAGRLHSYQDKKPFER